MRVTLSNLRFRLIAEPPPEEAADSHKPRRPHNQTRKWQNLHNRLLNLTGFFSSGGGAAAPAMVAAGVVVLMLRFGGGDGGRTKAIGCFFAGKCRRVLGERLWDYLTAKGVVV